MRQFCGVEHSVEFPKASKDKGDEEDPETGFVDPIHGGPTESPEDEGAGESGQKNF
jgi:hypothetical protein